MNGPLVKAVGLSRHYKVRQGILGPTATLRAVDNVSFTLMPGKTLAIVGESGCGKSTLGRLISLIEPPTYGTLTLAGIDALGARGEARSRLRKTVQVVFQDPYGSLNPRKRVGAILAEPLAINTKLRPAERRDQALAMMARVGLRPEHHDRYPHMFSGGQRQRIAIARALMLRPALVVADEPVSALDVSIQAQVLNLLEDLAEEFGVSYLFISHDLWVVRHLADEVAVMYLGRIVEQAEKAALYARPLHPYSRALLGSTPSVDRKRERLVISGELPSPLSPPAGCAFHTRCPHAEARCMAERPELREIAGHRVACHFAERFI